MSSSDDDDDVPDRGDAPALSADPRLQHNGALHNISVQPASLPSLEAINLKFSQIIDGIVSLARVIDADADRGLAVWPEILTKYNLLLSQSHLLSQTLASAVTSPVEDASAARPALSSLPRLVLHPTSATPEDQSLDFRVESLLRTMLLPTMVEQESSILEAFRGDEKDDDDEGLAAYESLEATRRAHDDTVSRTLETARALREQYDWTARVFVATPEDVPQSPSVLIQPVSLANAGGRGTRGGDDADAGLEEGSDIEDEDMPGDGSDEGTNTSDDAFLLEGELEEDKDEATASDTSRT